MWFLVWLCAGFVAGVLALLLIQIWWLFTPSSRDSDNASPVPMQFGAQFLPFRIPYELKQLLLSPGCEDKLKKKETCICLNLFVQFLYQEFRESKWFRRWIVKRLQMEFNELLSRTAAGKLLHDIKLRNFSVGTQFPVIKDIQVNRVTLAPDKDSFQDLDLTLDVDYRGGFEASVDVMALLGRQAKLAVKVTRVAGQARLQMTRSPYSHWSFSFVHEPIMEFKVDSEFRGRPLPQLVPLLINQFRRTVRKKHVLPAYKLRYRPFFLNPFFQPSVDPADYGHIEAKGIVRVTVIKCTRLNLAALIPANKQSTGELYCQLSTGVRPSNAGRRRREDSATGQNNADGSDAGSDNYVSIALRYVRHSSLEPFGLMLGKEYVPEKVSKMTLVVGVVNGSAADRVGFKKGDLVIAVNHVGITTERQAAKLMSNTLGDIFVLVERKLANVDEDDVSESLPSGLGEQSNPNLKIEFNSGDEFYHVSFNDDEETKSLYHQTEMTAQEDAFQRSQSDVDLAISGSGDAGATGEAIETSGENELGFDNDSGEHGSEADQTSTRKVLSASVMIPIPARKNASSNESVGSYSPSASIAVSSENSAMKKDGDEQQSSSSNSASPSLSRKLKIAAKATEKVAQVAQKWTTGKATVKDMWDRRQQRKKQSDGELTSAEGISASMTNSKSAEAELKLKVNDASVAYSLLSVEGVASRPRSRSHSEPDTSVLSVVANDGSASASVQGDKEKEELRSEACETSSRKVDPSSSVSPPQPPSTGDLKKAAAPITFQSQTKPVPLAGGEPVWYQNFQVPLDDKSRYLSVVVYWRDVSSKATSFGGGDGPNTSSLDVASDDSLQMKKTPSSATLKGKDQQLQQATGPVALGSATIFLPEVLDDCSITKSLCHQQSYALRPPSVAVKLTPAVEKLMLHPGFDARLCYGDITLGFQWLPDQKHSSLVDESAASEEQQQLIEVGKQSAKQSSEADGGNAKRAAKKPTETVTDYIIVDGHKWLSTHFQQSVVCHVCQKKVWLKSAYKCIQCGAVSHKKCIARAASLLGQCGQILETVAFESMSISTGNKTSTASEDQKDDGESKANRDSHAMAEMAAEAVEDTNGMDPEREHGFALSTPVAAANGAKKSTGLALSERLAGLRRRKPKAETAATSGAAAPTAVPTSLESLSNVDWGSSEDSSPFHSLLYTKCGTYNEHMILAAKDLGKDLYTTLPVEERKAKINEQIDRLQTEIDQTTDQRLELLKKQGTKADRGLMAELAKLDDKLQALAILMLHYCAGLQCCLDIEEASAAEGGVCPESLSMSVDMEIGEVKSAEGSKGDCAGGEDGLVGEQDEGNIVSSFTTTLKNVPSGSAEESAETEAEAEIERGFSMDDSSDEEKEEEPAMSTQEG